MMPAVTLSVIQAQVKAPKGQYNAFGKYRYRKAEDILEAVKPVIYQFGYWLTIHDSIEQVGDRYYVKATVTLTNGSNVYAASAYAREEESKKGMDGSQVTGASSSYARKYALSALFALDNGQADADATNTHETKQSEKMPQIDPSMDKATKEAMAYGWTDDWELEIKNCRSVEELTKIYNDNVDTFNKWPGLKKLLTQRKIELNGK